MKIRFAKAALAACVAVLAAGCNGGDSGTNVGGLRPFSLSIDQAQYAPGAVVQVTLRNTSNSAISYNFCPVQVQRGAGTSFTTVATLPASGSACPGASPLEAGVSTTTAVTLPTGLPTGTYRLFFSGVGPSTLSETDRSTGVFQVRVE